MTTIQEKKPIEEQAQRRRESLPALPGPRLPYHPAIEERFGIDKSGWMALVDAVFPVATTTQSVILALAYCRARGLDPFKRCVHIVPIWDKSRNAMVDTIWPGIGELRTTAFRTGAYAGRTKTEFGPDVTKTFGAGPQAVEVTFPEWAQVTVYRMLQGNRVEFSGPQVYWLETFSSVKSGAPNSMWLKRPRGQLDKCAEAAALRAAFPEEVGNEYIAEEAFHGRPEAPRIMQAGTSDSRPKSERLADILETTAETSVADLPTDEGSQETTDLPESPQPDAGEGSQEPPETEASERSVELRAQIEAQSNKAGLLGAKQELLAAKKFVSESEYAALQELLAERLKAL